MYFFDSFGIFFLRLCCSLDVRNVAHVCSLREFFPWMKFKKGGHDVVPIFTKKKCPVFVGKFFVFALFLILLFGSDITKVPEKQTEKVLFGFCLHSF